MRTSIAIAVATVLTLASCGKQLNPEYCAKFGQSDPDCQNGGLVTYDAAPPCATDQDCLTANPDRPACDLDNHTCVECWTDAHKQFCIDHQLAVCGDDERCHACLPPSQGCATGQTCIEGEGCVDPVADILYVSPGVGAGHACTQADHCSLTDAIAKLNAGPAHAIEIDDGDYPSGPYTITRAASVALLSTSGNATGVKVTLAPGQSGSVFTVATTGQVALEHLSLHDATADGVTCTSGTLFAHDVRLYNNGNGGLTATGCTVRLDRSDISTNQGVGVDLANSVIEVLNNFIHNNGTGGDEGGSDFGGVHLSGSTNGKLKFNTIVFNRVRRHGIGGLSCEQANTVNATACIITGNNETQFRTVGTNCALTPVYFNRPDGLFASPTDFHLAPNAPKPSVRDNPAADCSDVPVDFDGDTRPNPGGFCDLGADER